MSNFIPKERTSAYRPWQLKSLEGGGNKHAREREDAERIKMINQQAYREGLEAGYSKGAARATQEAARMAGVLDALTQELGALEQHMAAELVRLALTLASALVRESLKVHPELIEGIVRESIRGLPPFSPGARLRMHPDDAALVGKHLGSEMSGDWIVVDDPTITRGGCKLETTACEVDATIESRWQKLTAALAAEHDWIA
jgi:flagellar assembly protein FliH